MTTFSESERAFILDGLRTYGRGLTDVERSGAAPVSLARNIERHQVFDSVLHLRHLGEFPHMTLRSGLRLGRGRFAWCRVVSKKGIDGNGPFGLKGFKVLSRGPQQIRPGVGA